MLNRGASGFRESNVQEKALHVNRCRLAPVSGFVRLILPEIWEKGQ